MSDRAAPQNIRLVAACSLIVLFVIPFILVIRQYERFAQYSDYAAHIELARVIGEEGGRLQPHFLYHVMTAALAKATGASSYAEPALFVNFPSQAGAGLCVFFFLTNACQTRSRRGLGLLAVLSAALLYVTPVTLLTAGDKNLYFGYLNCANVYHNPTIVVLKPWALLTMLASVQYLNPTQRSLTSIQTIRSTAAIVVPLILATLAKPSFTMSFLPAYFVVSLPILFRAGEWRR